jgi:lactate dehydrogenase-like 2-hydroxyacid dehydrogenase
MAPRKPKVVTISPPNWADPQYLAEFERKFELHVSEAGDRQTTIKNLAAKVATDGPFDAICILMGTKPYEPFDEELLKPLVPQCKLMTSASAGYNEFDVDWMSRNGITFCNSRNAVNEASADLAIFMMLGVIRDVQRLQTSVANGNWRGGLVPARDPYGMKLGIVGMGNIGKHVARKAKVFNMQLLYYQRTRMSAGEEKEYDVTYCSTLDDLLSVSDIVSLHCPLNKNTEGMISHKEFAKMKDGVFFINTSRGPLANEEALIEALESGKICRAGLDVFHGEPKIK